MPSLRDATKARAGRKAASRVAKPPKTQKPAKTSTPAKSASTPSTAIAPTRGNAIASVDVPGLGELAPSQIAAQLPAFEPNSYSISDPLKPPTSLPQVNQTDFDAGQTIYEGSLRALKLTELAFDVSREKFNVVGKRAKAFGAGIKAATALEAVKGDYLDYQNQLEVTTQKSTALGVSQHKTVTDQTKSTYSQQEMDEKLEQARIAADLASEVTKEKQSGLDQFRKQLTGLAAAK